MIRSSATGEIPRAVQLQLNLRLSTPRPTSDQMLTELLIANGIDASILSRREFPRTLAEKLNVSVRHERINTSGQLLYHRAHPVILVCKDDPSVRQHYTLAHELAHLLVIRAKNSRCSSGRLAPLICCDNVSLLEWHVERLASAILLPAARVVRYVTSLHTNGIRGFSVVMGLRALFKASTTAACRRLADLHTDYLAISSSRRPVPGKPTRYRVDWSATGSSMVGFIPRNKSLPDFGLVRTAAEGHRLASCWLRVAMISQAERVVRAEALPNQRGGALLLIDLKPIGALPTCSEALPTLLEKRAAQRSTRNIRRASRI